jgi:tetratricopeptide (TPR) repeat protein
MMVSELAPADRLATAFLAASAALIAGAPGSALARLRIVDAALAECWDGFDAASVELLRGRAYRLAGDLGVACQSAAMAVELARCLPAGERERPLVQALSDAADFEREHGRLSPGRPMLEEALEVAVVQLGPADPDTVAAWNSLGMWYRYYGDLAAARAAYEKALSGCAQDGPDRAGVLHNLASLEQLEGEPDAAETSIREAMALRQPTEPQLTGDLGVLAAVLADLGRYDEAADIYDQVWHRLSPGSAADELAYLEANRAVLAHRCGQLDVAQGLYQSALAGAEQTFGPAHPQTGVVLANAAALAEDQGNHAAAAGLAARAVAVLAGAVGEQLPSLKLARAVLANCQ